MEDDSIPNPPFEINGIEHPDEDTLILTYQSDIHNVAIRRTFTRCGTTLSMSDEELQYNFTSQKWQRVRKHTHKYQLNETGTRLLGDGSGWNGADKQWEHYAITRHFKRLSIRLTDDLTPKAEIKQSGFQNLTDANII